ncbi:uncharacterized protein LOC132280030 [Cornus florida]|uniref:uncharacterized protein LOC132280030 n=1 Tax=Cornus florida TaxID=4283 RepID=UPI00289B3BE7|nr:uncharacterized protein LOC132280030 [Cornus florida]
MKGTSKVIMGATLVMVVGLAIVLGLVLVLLAELYCSLLLRRRKQEITTSSTTTAATTTTAIATDSSCLHKQPQDESGAAPPLSSFYAQGVLRAPRNFLFPAVSEKELESDIEKQQQSQPLQTQPPSSTPHRIGLVTPSPSSPSFVCSPPLIPKVSLQGDSSTSNDGVCGRGEEQFMYISNPIYDNEAGMPSRADTPFETPDTSPSHLEMGGFSGDDDQPSPSSPSSLPTTPPLTPMKKLPAEGCSVCLRDARSLATSGSDSNSNNGVSSSSSGSPCTSPSW